MALGRTITVQDGAIWRSFRLAALSSVSRFRRGKLVEREKDVVRTGPGSTFNQLVVGLVSLAGAEKQYLSLSFLLPRTSSVFLRKEQSLKSVYQSILLDVRNAMELEADVVVSRTCEDLLTSPGQGHHDRRV